MSLTANNPLVRRLKHPSDSDIDAIVNVLATAFVGDPFSQILLGGDLTLTALQLRSSVAAAAVGGTIHVLTPISDSTDIVGVAIWFAPGQGLNSTEEQRAAGWDQFMAAVPPALKAWWLDYFILLVSRLLDETLGPAYSLNAWHLHLFGVLPTHQRRGHGKSLFRFAEGEALKPSSPMLVETTTEIDVLIYQRLGFRIRAETPVKSTVSNGHMYLMTKEGVLEGELDT